LQVHEKVEESLKFRESITLQHKITKSFNSGPTNALPIHKYRFEDTLTNLLKKLVVEKKYWIATLSAS